MIALQSIGDCPDCGEELWVMKFKTGGRIAKCVNENCPQKTAYALPKKGKLERTGDLCPKSHVMILAVIPQLKLAARGSLRFKAQEKKTYFWAKEPCFACSQQNRCAPLKELKEEYLEETGEE
jgi:ssDNA-binding Zn-finger/Zn-ribbon topoisomerase 1